MILSFEQSASLGPGENPSVVHMPDNSIWLFGLENGRMKARTWTAETGDVPWDNPEFGDAMIATADNEMDYLRIKNVPRVGVFGSWHQDEVAHNGNIVSPERHRIGIWDALNDITNFLESGNIQLDLDNIVSSASFTFKNPNHRLSGESASRMVPGNKIELFFTAGDSEDYPMGVFYVDRVDMTVNSGSVTVDCRNISGKVLKDQMMDGQNYYYKDVYAYIVEELLTNAGITDYDIQQPADPLTAWQAGLQFPPDMDMLTALYEMIRISLNWTVRETLDGQIIAGSTVTYAPIQNMNSRYTFNRGKDLISRSVVRDDNDVYYKICYQCKVTDGGMRRYYVNVAHTQEWSFAPHKTLYVTMPDDTSLAELTELADNLAERMATAGTLEQFTGPFRPHIIPGDEAEIVAPNGTSYLGLITTVNHEFGDSGYFTSFTVDSGGIKGKPQLKDLISQASGTRSSDVKRLD